MQSFKEQYDAQGYVIVPNLVKSGDQLETLRQACDRVVERTRRGEWTLRRTVGKQFPPYGQDNPDSWGVQHIMHPGLGEKAFVEWYTSDALVDVVKVLMVLDKEDGEQWLQMELFNLLINPLNHDFALRWHRDDIRDEATEEEEKEALGKWQFGVQWNCALYVDSCLYVVPGSHLTPRTPEQKRYSSGQTLTDPLEMPGSVKVTLQVGETVFYNSNILHCAAYKSSERRATLHGCMGNSKGGGIRARNILQHGLEWMEGKSFRETLPNARAVNMLNKLIAMRDGVDISSVGYSLDG